MGIEEVIRRIGSEAEEERKEILTEALNRSKLIRSEEKARIESELKDMKRAFERDKANLVNIHMSEGRRKARQAVLAAKEQLIWEVMTGIRKGFNDLGTSELREYLIKLLEGASETLGRDMRVFAVRKLDAEVLEALGASVEGIIEGGSDLPGGVERLRSRSLIGGFIAMSGDARMTLDMTFQGMLDRDREEIRARISEVLFGE